MMILLDGQWVETEEVVEPYTNLDDDIIVPFDESCELRIGDME